MKTIGKIPHLLLYLLVSLSTLTETIYSAALPNIAEQLNTTGGIAQLSTTAYYLGFAIGILTLGRVSDIYGRRPIVLLGIGFYVIITFLITLSPNIESFIALRFLQAYGASVGSVLSQAMARDSYKGWELSYAYAGVGMVMSVVPSVGSALGGYIIEYYQEWQWVFKSLVMFSGVSLFIYLKFLPETNPYIGDGKNNRFYTVLMIALKDRTLLSYALMVGAFNGMCFGFYIQAPFIFIDNMGINPSVYGKLFMILSAANLIGALYCRHLIKRLVDTMKIQIIGLSFSVVGISSLLILNYFASQNISVFWAIIIIFVPMAIHLLGHALIVPMMLRNALENYQKVTGVAGSIFGFLYYIITAAVNFMISSLHSDSIDNFSYIAAILLAMCIVLFYYLFRWTNAQEELSLKV